MPTRIATIMLAGLSGLALALLSPMAQAQPTPQALPLCTLSGQNIGLSLNTGTGPLNPPPGRFDPIWRIQPTVDVFSTTRGPWFNPPPGSRWIQRSTKGNPVSFGSGLTVYITRFTTQALNTYQINSLKITGVLGADNNARVKLNGNTITTCTNCFGVPTPIPSFPVTFFNATPNYVNVFTIEVTNSSASPSGLLVRAAVSAVCQ